MATASFPDPVRVPSWLSRGRIPSLDGLRAIAVMLVLYAHAQHTTGFPLSSVVPSLSWCAPLGVNIFFVLSGFLITTLMLREIDRTGRLDVRQFYLRRLLRIVPAYACLLATLAILNAVGILLLSRGDWLSALTYTVNFYPDRSWPIGHIWSLSVEEHFYLLWPLAMAAGLAVARQAALACMVFCFTARWLLMLLAPNLVEENFNTFTRMDTLAAGCVLAMLARDPAWRNRLDRLTTRVWPILALLVLTEALRPLAYRLSIGLGYTLNALALTLLVWAVVRREHSFLGRLLNHRVLATVGIGSYSIYLWQQIFLTPGASGFAFAFPQNLVFALLAAWLSFQLIEKPFLSFKARVTGEAAATPETAPAPKITRISGSLKTPGRRLRKATGLATAGC